MRDIKKIVDISFIGLGKLGLGMAACFAYRGFNVTGIDINPTIVKLVNRGVAPRYEPGLDSLLKKCKLKGTLKCYSDYSKVAETDCTFVMIQTPSNKLGDYSDEYVKKAMLNLANVIKGKDKYHLIVLCSTVFPGTVDNFIRPLLEEKSGKRCGKDFGLLYNPEFLPVGDVIRKFLKQDAIVIGEYDKRSGDYLAGIYRDLCENSPKIARISVINAEIAKLSINSFVTMKMTFANMLSAACEAVDGGDVDQVTEAMGNDPKIGNLSLKGGLGYGGPCYPRDNKAMAAFFKKVGYRKDLPELIDNINDEIVKRVVSIVDKYAKKSDNIVLLGASYKPATPLVIESQSMAIATTLLKKGYNLSVHNPVDATMAADALKGFKNVVVTSDLRKVLSKGSFFILCTPWNEYNKLTASMLTKGKKGTVVVVDCWRALKSNLKHQNSKIKYVGLGLGDV